MRGIHLNGDFGYTGIEQHLMGASDLPPAAATPQPQSGISKEIWYFLAAVAALLILKKVLKK